MRTSDQARSQAGRLLGKKGGPARAASLTAEERSRIAGMGGRAKAKNRKRREAALKRGLDKPLIVK